MITVNQFRITPDGLSIQINLRADDTTILKSLTMYNHDDPSTVYTITFDPGTNAVAIERLMADIGLKATMLYGSILSESDGTESTSLIACSNIASMYHSLVDRVLDLYNYSDPLRQRLTEPARKQDIMMIHSLMYAHTQAMYLERFNDAAYHYDLLINEFNRLRR